ncbi:MAG: protein kinase [Lachnospiraceae bacterium]|nr:protein kinase [Lachnospiraceae bacterium]
MLFDDRYEKLETIYETQAVSVYLVRHRSLSENRILKCIKKNGTLLSDTSRFAGGPGREADIMKGLRHPGIPVLYDYEEDEESICLIEEYVQGMPLSDYLDWRDSISIEQICSFLMQICEIVAYLHKREPFPILYQDMKPEHLFLRGEKLMLIDYGAALFVPHSGRTFQKYGTPGFAAPEIVANGTTSVRTDIYSVGRVAEILIAHTKEHVPSRMMRLVRWAVRENPEERPDSIEAYKMEWEKACAKYTVREKNSFPATIVVTGASKGCGTTHIAISLTVFLNALGHRAYFADRTDSRSTQCMCQNVPGFCEKDTVIYHHHFQAILNTGSAVQPQERPKGIRVVDGGCSLCEDEEPDLTLCVVGSRPWQEQAIDFSMLPQDAAILINPANRFVGGLLAQVNGRKLAGYPIDKDPFTLSREKRKLFGRLIGRINGILETNT